MSTFDVFALCNPLYDLQVQVSDALLVGFGFPKGGVCLIDREQYDELIPKLAGLPIHATPGGSAANTVIGIQQLGGTTCYTGKVGADSYGAAYRNGMISRGVQANLGVGSQPTGLSVILITPDAQRTMFTYLGACRELGLFDIDPDAIAQSRYLYVTGYCWDTQNQKDAVLFAMEQARAAGVPIALSLSDPFVVRRHKEELRRVVNDHVDVLFGNQEEAEVFTETSSPEAAVDVLRSYCNTAVVTMSAAGSYIAHGSHMYRIEPFAVAAVDATGAGDMYAAGLLYGLTHDLSISATGRLASYLAARVVAQLGPRLDAIDPQVVEELLAEA
ncbi:adenosine kinase [Gloeobacter morelensis]|uniref:Adenosine kinase n=1 Tax=Gloeobacter morelensis MG652769 TaxID=2781736 RepID=A0ABY3PNU4_9CYAN|nr:adenosine kinase [Gloeobacter morelensis]UFP95366.1 adenosine kinase [Gloeobacter morelensis MG652769]